MLGSWNRTLSPLVPPELGARGRSGSLSGEAIQRPKPGGGPDIGLDMGGRLNIGGDGIGG